MLDEDEPAIFLTVEQMADLAQSVDYARRAHALDVCSGEHIPRQHRDGKPPWCRDCGRDRYGAQIVDVR